LSEEGFDFLLDGHGWLVASVEVGGGRWQTDGVSPSCGYCVKSSNKRV
jgi:hypothetical protein